MSDDELAVLKAELTREDLRIYAVVRMAALDVEAGNVEGALARLRVDADKLRMHETVLNDLLKR